MRSNKNNEHDKIIETIDEILAKSKNKVPLENNRRRIKKIGEFQISKNQKIMVEIVSWSGKEKVVEIMKYDIDEKPLKGMQFDRAATNKLIDLLGSIKNSDFDM